MTVHDNCDCQSCQQNQFLTRRNRLDIFPGNKISNLTKPEGDYTSRQKSIITNDVRFNHLVATEDKKIENILLKEGVDNLLSEVEENEVEIENLHKETEQLKISLIVLAVTFVGLMWFVLTK